MHLHPAPADFETRHPQRHDRALAYMKSLLLDGGLEPNDVISTEDIARALAISRAPVTDAVKRLVSDGFVTVIPQVGCRITSPQPVEVADFYRLFARSEAVIVGLAAERRRPHEAIALSGLIRDLDHQFVALKANHGNGAALRALNRRRYAAIHTMARSRIAGELVANMWDRSDFYIRVAYGQFICSAKVQKCNQDICRAIVRADAPTAMQLTEEYLTHVGGQMAARMAKQSAAASA